jgi:hypothetical protein
MVIEKIILNQCLTLFITLFPRKLPLLLAELDPLRARPTANAFHELPALRVQ